MIELEVFPVTENWGREIECARGRGCGTYRVMTRTTHKTILHDLGPPRFKHPPFCVMPSQIAPESINHFRSSLLRLQLGTLERMLLRAFSVQMRFRPYTHRKMQV
jgi:hypothetical protein